MAFTTEDLEAYTRDSNTRGYSIFLSPEGWSANIRTPNGWKCGEGYYPTLEEALAQFLDPQPKPEKRKRRALI